MGTSIFQKLPLDTKFPEGHKVLNMGCGTAKFKDPAVTNVDGYSECNPDVVWDLENPNPFPFESNTFNLVIFNHVLEHVKGWWHCFEEGARVLKPGGMMIVYVPAPGNDSQLGYRDHVTIINQFSFFGIKGTHSGTNAWAAHNQQSPVNSMRMIAVDHAYYNKWWLQKTPAWFKRWCGEHLRNVMDEIGFVFRKES